MTYSKQFVADTARAWLASQIRNFAIDPYDAEEVYSEVMETSDLDSMGDYLDGAGYPELAEQWERDWHVEDISVEELYVELTEGETDDE